MMGPLFLVILIVMIWFVSSVAHEYDLHRNFKKTGDAKAWFFEIKKDTINEDS